MYESMIKVITSYGLISGFAVIGITMWFSYWLSDTFTKGRLHGSAIAILLGLVLSYIGGAMTGGQKGVVDLPLLSGIGLLGGAMLRDFAIVATAFGVNVNELKRRAMWACCRCLSALVRHSLPVSRLPLRLVTPMRSA